MPKKSADPEKSDIDDSLSFEDAMDELESLVRGVDSNRVPLDEMIVSYEKGTRLYKICKKRLEEARGRIELIRKRNDENVALEPFGDSESAANAAQPAPTAEKPILQDGELF